MTTAVADEQIAEAVRTARDGLEIRIPSDRPVTASYLCELGSEFELYRFEAGREGEIVISPPPGGTSARTETKSVAQLVNWEEALAGGESYGGNYGYDPTGGRPRIPDASWMSPETAAVFNEMGRPGEQAGFAKIAPDFVLEVRSHSQALASQQQKMEDWREWGVALGLLVDPESQTVHVYRPNADIAVHQRPDTVSCEPELPGLTLDFQEIWTLPWP